MNTIQNKRRTSTPLIHVTGNEFLKSNGYHTPDTNKSKLQHERHQGNSQQADNNSSVSSSTNTVASLNRSRDSGFFQDGANERSIYSLTFDNHSMKNRSMADERSKTLGGLEMTTKNESRPKSVGNIHVVQPIRKVTHQQGQGDLKDRSGTMIDETHVRNETRPSLSCSSKNGFNDLNGNEFRDEIDSRSIDDDDDDDELYSNDTLNQKYNHNGHDGQNVSKPLKTFRKHSPPTTDHNLTNACNPHPFDSLYDDSNYETNVSRQKTNNNDSLETGKSRRFNGDGRTRASEKVAMTAANDSTDGSSIQDSEELFDMFGCKLSDVCRQLLLSDFEPRKETVINKRKSLSSESTNSNTLSDRSVVSNDINKGSIMDIDYEDDTALHDDLKATCQIGDFDFYANLENESISDGAVKSIAPEFSLKINKQPTWSMAPVLPEPLHCESITKDTQIPLYCKFVRQSLKDDVDDGKKSLQGFNTDSMINRGKQFEEQLDHEDVSINFILQERALEFKTHDQKSNKELTDFQTKNKSINNDATSSIETKQTSLSTSGKRGHSVKSFKTKNTSKSPRDRSVSRRRKEYLHEISLEIIKTIEEELRISHQWNGISPSETIAKRLDHILSNHQQKRLHFGLTEPSNRELYDLLIDRIALQDPDYFTHRGARVIPLRSLSPPRQIEDLVREDSGFNLEKRLALLLRMQSSEGFERRSMRDDFEPATKSQPFLQLQGVHQTRDANFQPDVCDFSQRESSSRSDNLNDFRRSKNDVLIENADVATKPLKKMNVMQTQIPFNDKVLEIVLNVSEPELKKSSNLDYQEANNPPIHPIIDLSGIKGDEKVNEPQSEKIIKHDSRIFNLHSNDFKSKESQNHQNEKIIIATEIDEPKPALCFNLLPSATFPHSDEIVLKPDLNLEIAECKYQSINQSINNDQSSQKPSSENQETTSPDATFPDVTTSLTQLVQDEVFEADERETIEPYPNKSYQSLSLGNKIKSLQKRRIRIMSSQPSETGDGLIVSNSNGKDDGDYFKSYDTEQNEFKDFNISDINNNTNVTCNNDDDDDVNVNSNNNNRHRNKNNNKKSNDSSSNSVSINSKLEKSSEMLDQTKTRKKVTFNPDLSRQNTYGGDATSPSAINDMALCQGHFEGLERNQGLRDTLFEPNKTIFVNKYLEFSGNTVKETNLVLTPTDSPVINSMNKNEIAILPEVMNRKASSGEQDDIEDSINNLQSILQSNRGEPLEIELSQMRNLKISVPRDHSSTPSPPRLIRNLNPVKVTDFSQAQSILRKAFKDRNFGKAYDDNDVVPFRPKAPFIISKRKSRKLRLNSLNVDEELIEKVLKDVEVQTEQELNCNASGVATEEVVKHDGVSFSFLMKLGLALFGVIMAIVMFYMIDGDQSIDSSSIIDGRNPVG